MTVTDFWKLLAGLGMFLYGMFHLEDTIKQVEGRRFKLFLQRHTKKKLSAIFSGTIVTGIFQSSSIVNLMVLSFVGAGMLTMRNAMAVALGANVGGTFNSWLIALLGFKVDIGKFTLPIIGIAGLGLIIFRNKKPIFHLSKFFMGLGLLFLGLAFMKESMDSLIINFDFKPYLGYSLFVFTLIGFIITSLIQTSSATVVITLSALYAKIIPIETAVAVVLGAELGTTIKLLIGSIGGIAAKKRVALGNILFNVTTSFFGFIFLVPIVKFIRDVIGFHDPIIILVSFQTFINIGGVIAFYYFLGYYGNFLDKCFTDDKNVATSYLKNASPEITDTAIEMMEKEVGLFIYRVIQLNMEIFQIRNGEDASPFRIPHEKQNGTLHISSLSEKYKIIKQAEGEIFAFYSKMLEENIRKENLVHLNQLMSAVRNAMYAAKGMKDIDHDRKDFSNSINELKFDIYTVFRSKLSTFYSELNKTFELEDKTLCYKKLAGMLEAIKTEYGALLNTSYKNAGTDKMKEVDISTLFNVNRELYSSCKAIIFSMKDYKLDATGAAEFENIAASV